jgi:uncharacterized membrane protein YfhO
VVLLPLVIWGIEKIVKASSPCCYILALAAAIITNYYIGFMICIFSVLYMAYYFFFVWNKRNYKAILVFGTASALAGGLSAFVLLPIVYALQGGKADSSLYGMGFRANFPLFDLFSKFLLGSHDESQIWFSGLPSIYCGLIVLVFAIYFFLLKGTGFREKFGAGLLLLIFIVSFHVNTFNRIWHGLNPTTGFLFRYAFIFSFLLTSLAYQGFVKTKDELAVKNLIIIFLSMTVLVIFIEERAYQYLDNIKLYANMIFLFLVLLLSYLYIKKKSAILAGSILALICFFELGANAYFSLDAMPFRNYQAYTSFVRSNRPIIERLK